VKIRFSLLTTGSLFREAYTLSEARSITSIEPEYIVIINDEDAHWTLDEVHQFISDIPNQCFYIGKKQVPIEGDVLHRFAAVSFRAQFIGNLMNVLRYRP